VAKERCAPKENPGTGREVVAPTTREKSPRPTEPGGRRSSNLTSCRSGSPVLAAKRNPLNPRTLKFLALGYSLKIILLGLVCLMVPDFPARAMSKARQLWTAVGGPSAR
jgi:hypothetical protein